MMSCLKKDNINCSVRHVVCILIVIHIRSISPGTVDPVSCIFSVTWLAGDVKEPTHLSERVGDEIPGVVVYLAFHAYVGWVS